MLSVHSKYIKKIVPFQINIQTIFNLKNSLIDFPVGHLQVRHLLDNGSLYFPPFDAGSFRQDIHWASYKCVSSNTVGTIFSRDLSVKAGKLRFNHHFILILHRTTLLPPNFHDKTHACSPWRDLFRFFFSLRNTIFSLSSYLQHHSTHTPPATHTHTPVVNQHYDPEVQNPGAFIGSNVLIKCNIPSFVKDYVTVTSWLQEPSFNIYPSMEGGKYPPQIQLPIYTWVCAF